MFVYMGLRFRNIIVCRILNSGLFRHEQIEEICSKCVLILQNSVHYGFCTVDPLDKSKLEVHQCLRVCDTQHLPAVAMQR